jgi:hypothetical protein
MNRQRCTGLAAALGMMTLALFLGACENPSGGSGSDAEANAAREAADTFYLEHTAVLELPVDSITLGGTAPVDAALEAYAGLSAGTQALLVEEKAHLDRLTVKLAGLRAMAEQGAYYTAADLGAYLAAQPENTVDTPYTAVYIGNETPKALYKALAAGGRFVDLNLAESGVGGFNTGAEDGRERIVHLTLPDSLTEIRDGNITYAWGLSGNRDAIFNGLTNLKSVSAANVITVGSNTFRALENLTVIDLPKAAVINASAFGACTALTTVSLPEAVTLDSAFNSCTSLTTVSLPKAAVLGSTFEHCTSLVTITLPEAVTFHGFTFRNCTSLTTVTLPKMAAIDDPLVFLGCTALTTVNLAP